ncbi:MAG: glycosyltransferase [Pseudonocardiaceae bacterium]
MGSRPRLGRAVKWFGPASFEAKVRLLADASAVLCPFQWAEPFCLVAAEAMACGTAVITTPRGAGPELVVDQVTGFLVEPDGLANAVRSADRIDPWACRSHAEITFGLPRMASGYAEIYRGALTKYAHPTTRPRDLPG